MQSVYSALVTLGLDSQVSVTTANSLTILASSFPPSAGSFRPKFAQYLQPILDFISKINSTFLITAYPWFVYKDSPNDVDLDYVLFRMNQGTIDSYTWLKYDNMLYAQIDAVYAAIKLMGHEEIVVKVSETGWPSKGDAYEASATPENAGIYKGICLRELMLGKI
ncbi:hypothetical protein QQ045_030268 [Rhodiola kirilowii]